MFHRTLAALLTGFLAACASTHPGHLGKSVSGNVNVPLSISAQTIDEGTSDAFQMIEITLENQSDNWVKVANSQIIINDPNPAGLSVVVGEDLKNWARASAAKRDLDRHNRELLQAGIVTAGLVAALVGASKGDVGLAGAGGAVAAGGYGWVLADAVQGSLRKTEGAQTVPDEHIYHPVSVPGKMFVRRWVLLNKKPGYRMQSLALEIETVEGEKESYVISL